MTDRTPRLSARRVERVLRKHGSVQLSQRGSHHKWLHPERRRLVIVPEHGNRPLPIGTLNA